MGNNDCMYRMNVEQTCTVLADLLTGKNQGFSKETYNMVHELYNSAMEQPDTLKKIRAESDEILSTDRANTQDDERFLKIIESKVQRYITRKNNEAGIWKRKYEELLTRFQKIIAQDTIHRNENNELRRKVKKCHEDKLEQQWLVSNMNTTLEVVKKQRDSHKENYEKTQEQLTGLKADHSACQKEVAETNKEVNSELQFEVPSASVGLESSLECERNLATVKARLDATEQHSKLLEEQVKAAMHHLGAVEEGTGGKLEECLTRKCFLKNKFYVAMIMHCRPQVKCYFYVMKFSNFQALNWITVFGDILQLFEFRFYNSLMVNSINLNSTRFLYLVKFKYA